MCCFFFFHTCSSLVLMEFRRFRWACNCILNFIISFDTMFHNRKYRQTPSILLLLCTVTSYPSFLCVYLEIIFEWQFFAIFENWKGFLSRLILLYLKFCWDTIKFPWICYKFFRKSYCSHRMLNIGSEPSCLHVRQRIYI